MTLNENKIMLGDLYQNKMAEFERRRRYTTSVEFYTLDESTQDKLIKENRALAKEIEALKVRINELSDDNKRLSKELAQVTQDGSLWLSDVIIKEQPEFKDINLIVSPVGSGKTHTITELLAPKGGDVQLLLVSTTHLKNSIAPNVYGDKKRREDGIGVFTTQNRNSYGRDKELWVMTYSEFGSRIEWNEDFINENNITEIYADEIHSLIEYINFSDSRSLFIALRYLMNRTEGVTKYFFTATTEHLDDIIKCRPEWFAEITKFDYSAYPDIKKYTAMNESNFSHIEQLRKVLRSHSGDFLAYGKKGLFFGTQIATLKTFATLLEEEGFRPLILWSTNNKDHEMTKEQLSALNYLVEHSEIPEGYDFLLINGAMREGWNLHDKSVELVIINSTRETDIIQARGRVRKNIATLMVRSDDKAYLGKVEIPQAYLNKDLTIEERNDFMEELNLIDSNGRKYGWSATKQLLIDRGYSVKEYRKSVLGVRTRYYMITND